MARQQQQERERASAAARESMCLTPRSLMHALAFAHSLIHALATVQVNTAI